MTSDHARRCSLAVRRVPSPLFTDVEGSTSLLRDLGAEAYADALAEHRRVVREMCAAEGGVEVDRGDAFFVPFPSAPAGSLAVSHDANRDGSRILPRGVEQRDKRKHHGR